jgi:uncharacterized protein YjbI with pentapeptide repeats
VNDPYPSAPRPRGGDVGRGGGHLRLVPGTAPDDPLPPPIEDARTDDRQRPQFDLSGQTITGLHLHDAILARSSFVDTELHRVRITDAVIRDSDLMTAVFDTAELHRVTFRGCRMAATLFTRSLLRAVRFEDCTLVAASFVHSTLDEVTFDGCDLADADLHPDHAWACRFASCDLSRLNVTGDPGSVTRTRPTSIG